jgi:hypothetical protein
MDFFEMERVLEELVRTFASPSATTWFKVTGHKRPTLDEYRMKVAEFMNLFESALSSGFQNDPNSNDILNFIKKGVRDHTTFVLSGKNKEVEKRYKYYVEYG